MNLRLVSMVAALVTCAGYGALWLDGPRLDALLAEDGPVESLGASALFAASVLFATNALREGRGGRGRFCLCLALVLFVGGGEEISWGQRIFGWGTPAAVAAHNLQGETNLHNLAWMNGWLDAGRLFNVFTFAYFVALPLALSASARLQTAVAAYAPVWPAWIALPFVVNQLASKVAQYAVGEDYAGAAPLVHAVTELKETQLAVLYVVLAVLHRHALVTVPAVAPALGAGARA